VPAEAHCGGLRSDVAPLRGGARNRHEALLEPPRRRPQRGLGAGATHQLGLPTNGCPLTTKYVLGTGGGEAKVDALGQFAYQGHEFGSGLSQTVGFVDREPPFPACADEAVPEDGRRPRRVPSGVRRGDDGRDLEEP
jgi:hypothetical protein